MATQTEYAWAAGFIDGEGCISLHIRKILHGRTRNYPSLQLIVVQKDERPLLRLKEIFGCDNKIDITHRSDRRLPYYRFVISGERAAQAIEKILPYLVLKREVAEVALELQNDIRRYSGVYGRAAVLSDATLKYRKGLVGRAKWLNSGRWAAAEKQASGTGDDPVCGAPNCNDGKVAEVDRNDLPVIH